MGQHTSDPARAQANRIDRDCLIAQDAAPQGARDDADAGAAPPSRIAAEVTEHRAEPLCDTGCL